MKKLVSLLAIITISFNSFSSHYIGGNFTVVQTGANTFSITLQAFRDCAGITLPNSLTARVYRQSNNSLFTSVTLTRTQQFLVSLGDDCYTPSLCIQENIYVNSSVNLANEPGGYYVTFSECCRNGGITNINNPASASMTFYADIPDPALAGGNSTPVFGSYPADGYFCINNTITRDFSAVDPDGDSLVYSLITPYALNTTGPKPFPTINWQVPYNLANICGGTPPMSINPQTGIITANANVAGVFVFSVLVEEYRNGVKIGATHRDVQYQALACQLDAPPQFSNLSPNVDVYVNQEACFDILAYDDDITDTIYLTVSSPDLNIAATYIPPTYNGVNYTYTNFQGAGNLSVNHYVVSGNNYEGIGQIPMRFCFTPACEDLDETFTLNLMAYSLGCSGSDTVQTSVLIHVLTSIPILNLDIPDTVNVTLNDRLCFDLIASDNINLDDTLFIKPIGFGFDYLGSYVPPTHTNIGGQSMHYYTDFIGQDTVWINNYSYVNGTAGAVINVPMRYCMDATCESLYIGGEYILNYMAFSTSCGSDTVYKSSRIIVDPIQGGPDEIPNIFTPNGDGINDYFTLRGINDPCYDEMEVKIYNRWGVLVYESNDPEFKWDGNNKRGVQCAEGTYFVLIEGSYGSIYDLQGNRTPVPVKKQYTIQLQR
ncbi:MAG: gliding motility-associated C-terminal domain-containing protein [Flavobacteriales bacterium]